jgi:hypothetical protein
MDIFSQTLDVKINIFLVCPFFDNFECHFSFSQLFSSLLGLFKRRQVAVLFSDELYQATQTSGQALRSNRPFFLDFFLFCSIMNSVDKKMISMNYMMNMKDKQPF